MAHLSSSNYGHCPSGQEPVNVQTVRTCEQCEVPQFQPLKKSSNDWRSFTKAIPAGQSAAIPPFLVLGQGHENHPGFWATFSGYG
ncbi:hypothetical protein N7528_006285 [Penicillium herquei]|nr:hypothetical protein N7528_006285 [Penicillium herquei]